MLEYTKEQEDKLLRAVITELKPRVAAQMLPGLPAYVLFMLIRSGILTVDILVIIIIAMVLPTVLTTPRHLDHINDDKNVRSLIQTGISHIKKTIKKRGESPAPWHLLITAPSLLTPDPWP